MGKLSGATFGLNHKVYIHIYIYAPPPPWTLVLLPFGDGKSRILEISNCGSPKRDNLEPGVLHNVPV